MNATSNSDAPVWFTSSYSNGSGGECVECAVRPIGTLVRDSKEVDGPVVSVSRDRWVSFLQAATSGQLRSLKG